VFLLLTSYCNDTSNGYKIYYEKVEYLKGHFWEVIEAMWVKFLFDLDYPHTEFHPILSGTFAAKTLVN